MKSIRYNISESFNIIRWTFVIIMFAFVSVITVAKYLSYAEFGLMDYATLEIVYIILKDTVNQLYLYIPMYLFLVAGIVFDDNFGSIEVLKEKSRHRWYFSKIITMIFYTMMFILVGMFLTFTIVNMVFQFSDVWTADYMNMSALLGGDSAIFEFSPLAVVLGYAFNMFLRLSVLGMISLIIAINWNNEAISLFSTLVISLIIEGIMSAAGLGISLSTASVLTGFAAQITIVVALLIIVYSIGRRIVNKKDFIPSRK